MFISPAAHAKLKVVAKKNKLRIEGDQRVESVAGKVRIDFEVHFIGVDDDGLTAFAYGELPPPGKGDGAGFALHIDAKNADLLGLQH